MDLRRLNRLADTVIAVVCVACVLCAARLLPVIADADESTQWEEQTDAYVEESSSQRKELPMVALSQKKVPEGEDVPESESEDVDEDALIDAALEAQGYFSAAVPLCWEYQDYMRTYCRLYGCPYPMALAVADWETRGQFNMDAVGADGEVGIMQLHPGPDGSYHKALETATGLDPTTPEGNIAGGCYLLGKYLAEYEDITMALMAYNMGQARARSAWDAGITSTGYTEAVLEAMEQWECEVNAWAGE